jgi:hypothetical protein
MTLATVYTVYIYGRRGRKIGRPESSIYGEAGAAFHLCITNTAAIDRWFALASRAELDRELAWRRQYTLSDQAPDLLLTVPLVVPAYSEPGKLVTAGPDLI